ncbi:MAG: hypothetical protein EA424_08475 [Planctomycetaceae bacterium]|nr:MAG: hypothetical protein EA424_08475 [Planctomycetaceae bacterium]
MKFFPAHQAGFFFLLQPQSRRPLRLIGTAGNVWRFCGNDGVLDLTNGSRPRYTRTENQTDATATVKPVKPVELVELVELVEPDDHYVNVATTRFLQAAFL